MKRNKGITLIALTITIIILLIVASISTYSGIETIKSSKFNKFTQELEIMQAQVNLLYDKYYSNGQETTKKIGKDIPSGKMDKATKALRACNVEESEKGEYRLFDEETIKELGVEGITREYLVNIRRRDIISLEEFQYNGISYYRLSQIHDKVQVEKSADYEEVSFEISDPIKTVAGWEIKISNIRFSEHVGKGKIQYRKEGTTDVWETIEVNDIERTYTFTMPELALYEVKVTDVREKSKTERTGVPIPEDAELSKIPGEADSINNGIVVYVRNNGVPIDWSKTEEELKNQHDQFVWIPVRNAIVSNESELAKAIAKEQYPMAIINGKNSSGTTNYKGILYNFELEGNKVVAKLEEKSKGYDEPIYLSDNTNADTGDKNNVGITPSSIQNEFNEMVNKVSYSNGFWVGRYETTNMENNSSVDNTNKVAVKKGINVGLCNASWYRMYAQQKKYSELVLTKSQKLSSSMIWGSQWDQIMVFMKNIKNGDSYYIINAAGIGNFSGPDDGYSGGTPTNTGCFKVNNIYDLAGNAWDWTLEALNSSYRVARGGCSINGAAHFKSAIIRNHTDMDSGDLPYFGSRMVLLYGTIK
ncbi:MAG: formylglycine-generating enzyme family protein [Clostridia bacterium]|nr:formylglycine-generating enzyme family protein [Clostridia bacterium]